MIVLPKAALATILLLLGGTAAGQLSLHRRPVAHALDARAAAPQLVNDTLFVAAVLNTTNVFRRQHNASAAVWNATLAAFADDYLARDADCDFVHSRGPYGENLAIGCSDVASCVAMWGNERRAYSFVHPAFAEQTGHFSQLVWKSSTTVGCGRRLCAHNDNSTASLKNTGWFLVCEYWPRGNIIGQFADQVSRQVEGPFDDDYVDLTSRPSSGLITAALVVLVLVASAIASDMMSVLRQ